MIMLNVQIKIHIGTYSFMLGQLLNCRIQLLANDECNFCSLVEKSWYRNIFIDAYMGGRIVKQTN